MAQYVYTMNRVAKIVPAEARDPQEHFPVVLPRRQDRRTRSERLGQIDTAEHHGRHRYRDRRRGPAAAGLKIGLPAAGTAAGPSKDVRGNVEEGVGELKALLTEFNEIYAASSPSR